MTSLMSCTAHQQQQVGQVSTDVKVVAAKLFRQAVIRFRRRITINTTIHKGLFGGGSSSLILPTQARKAGHLIHCAVYD
jgi:hypothetical protein